MFRTEQLLGVVKGGHRRGALAALVLSACGVTTPSGERGDVTAAGAIESALGTTEKPRPGAAGIGDPLFPTLGNGGYEVVHYQIDLRYETASPSQSLDGTVRMFARATQALSQLDVDFAGDSVGGVSIGDAPAAFVRDGEDLVITLPRPIARGELFVITVADFVAIPKVPSAGILLGAPFFLSQDGSAWAGQPGHAHQIFPCNDHPSNKATFSFRIDVPTGTTAVASGVDAGVETANGRTIYSFEQREPMATELAQVAVGAFTVVPRTSSDGVIVRDVIPTRLLATLEPKLAVVTDHLTWLEDRLGGYPFPIYGSLVVQASLGFALESQTLSLYQSSFFSSSQASYGPIMVHELSHQWFGDSVAPARWSDVWQNEGHATWYERTFSNGPDSPAFVSFMRSLYASGDVFRANLGPVASPPSGNANSLFNSNVYNGGALALFALRQQVGDAAFQQIERTWVTRFRGLSATTDDFIALASEVSGQDVTEFLRDWLYGTITPPMPGHPDWTVTPANLMSEEAATAMIAAFPIAHAPPVDESAPLLRY
jgi:aminopeptidase N